MRLKNAQREKERKALEEKMRQEDEAADAAEAGRMARSWRRSRYHERSITIPYATQAIPIRSTTTATTASMAVRIWGNGGREEHGDDGNPEGAAPHRDH